MPEQTLEREKTVAVCQNRGNYDGKMVLTSEGKAELKWWSENVGHMAVRPLIKLIQAVGLQLTPVLLVGEVP